MQESSSVKVGLTGTAVAFAPGGVPHRFAENLLDLSVEGCLIRGVEMNDLWGDSNDEEAFLPEVACFAWAMDASSLIDRLRAHRWPCCSLVVMLDPRDLSPVLNAGPCAVVEPSAGRAQIAEELLRCVRSARAHRAASARALVGHKPIQKPKENGQASLPRAPEPTRVHLTPREKQVMALAIQGLTDREIGGELKCQARTVKFHIRNLLAKLRVRSRRDFDKFSHWTNAS